MLGAHQSRRLPLTKEGIDEAVPDAATWPDEPASLSAGGKAERGAHDAHHHVAHRDVHQQQVNRRP